MLSKKNFIHFILLFAVLNVFFGCIRYPSYNEPDIEKFKKLAARSALTDSLAEGKLSVGMPYYLIEEIFKNWSGSAKDTKIPVASLGSRQRLSESEGWGRLYVDPNIQVFMDEYNTSKGKLYVWYQYPDFYRTDVSQGDTLILFFPDTVISSVVASLKKNRVLYLSSKLSVIPSGNLYGEIHYADNPRRRITYWYSLRVLSDGKTVLLKDLQYEIYPVELFELNGNPINSFKWK